MLSTPPGSPRPAVPAGLLSPRRAVSASAGAASSKVVLDEPNEYYHLVTRDAAVQAARPDDAAAASASRTAALVAQGRTAAVVGVAENYVRVKAIEVPALVEVQRLREEASTSCCRALEEERSRRFDRLAGYAELAVTERNRTLREREADKERTKRETVAALAKVEETRIRSRQEEFTGIWPWALSYFSFVLGARGSRRSAPNGSFRRARSRVKYILALIVIMFIRELWRLSDQTRATLLKNSFGPALTGIVQGALRLVMTLSGDFASSQDTLAAAASEDSVGCPSELLHALTPWGLGEYVDVLDRWGFDREILRRLSEPAGVDEMLDMIHCRPGHRDRFRAALRSWR